MVSVYCRISSPWPNTDNSIRLINMNNTKVPIKDIAAATECDADILSNLMQRLHLNIADYRSYSCIYLTDIPALLFELGWTDTQVEAAVKQLDFSLGSTINEEQQKNKAPKKKRQHDEIVIDLADPEEDEQVYSKEIIDAFAKEMTSWLGMNGLAIVQNGDKYKEFTERMVEKYINANKDRWREDLYKAWTDIVKQSLYDYWEPRLREQGLTFEEEMRIAQEEGLRLLGQQPPRKDFK